MLATNSLIVILVVGLIAGWLAGQIMRGSGLAFIGTWLGGVLHLPTIGNFWINAIVISTTIARPRARGSLRGRADKGRPSRRNRALSVRCLYATGRNAASAVC